MRHHSTQQRNRIQRCTPGGPQLVALSHWLLAKHRQRVVSPPPRSPPVPRPAGFAQHTFSEGSEAYVPTHHSSPQHHNPQHDSSGPGYTSLIPLVLKYHLRVGRERRRQNWQETWREQPRVALPVTLELWWAFFFFNRRVSGLILFWL